MGIEVGTHSPTASTLPRKPSHHSATVFILWHVTQYHERGCNCSEQAIALAILRLVEQEKAVVEGAGAAGVAAILENKLPELKGKR